MRRCSRPGLRARWLGLPWPFLLLFVQLVQRLSYYVVFGPVHGRAPDNVLRLWNGGELGLGGFHLHVCRILARICGQLRYAILLIVVVVALLRICEASQGRSQRIAWGLGCLRALLVDGARKVGRVGDCG